MFEFIVASAELFELLVIVAFEFVGAGAQPNVALPMKMIINVARRNPKDRRNPAEAAAGEGLTLFGFTFICLLQK